MGLEILFLLLPIAALSGWYLGRRGSASKNASSDSSRCDELPLDYLKGLNYLLNEQQDKAIDVFIQMLSVDSDTVETHMALATLFRRRGEVERSIRIHQNLIARPTLMKSQRVEALYELGNDYMRAGLYDRAESLFSELTGDVSYGVRALYKLLSIFEQEKDWEKAIETAFHLKRSGNKTIIEAMAHYQCELAELALARGEYSATRKMAGKALSFDKGCSRASWIEGRVALQQGNYRQAIRALKRMGEQAPHYYSEALPLLMEGYQNLGKGSELLQELEGFSPHEGESVMALAKVDLVMQQQGIEAADTYLTRSIERDPSVATLLCLVKMKLMAADQQDEYRDLVSYISNHLEQQNHYRCNNCGYEAKELQWHCPSCKNWSSARPIRGEVH